MPNKRVLCVTDLDRGSDVVGNGRIADNFWTRLRGLIGTRPLQPGDGLLIKPCNSVHMFFMGYPIDVVYLDAENRVLRVAAELAPWRVGPIVSRARCVLELPAGQAARVGIQVNDRLALAS